jgi:hypothetical protein
MSAATTVNNTLFGAAGVTDAKMFHPGLVSIERTIDFSKSNTAASTEYALFGLPKGFVAIGAFIESGADKNGNYPTATAFTPYVRDASDGDDDVAIGGSFTPSNSAYLRATKLTAYTGTVASTTATISGGPSVFDSGAIVSVTFGVQTHGYVKIGVFGYVPDGDSLGNVATPAPRGASRATATDKDNVAKLDPYYG